jgi:hypothetical protein
MARAGRRPRRRRDIVLRNRAALAAITLGAGLAGPALLGFAPAAAQQLDTNNLVPCAQENGVCRMPYPTNVYFGVPGRTNGRPFPQGGAIACNVQSFGDPAPGVVKSCFYAPRVSDRRSGGGGGYGRGGYDDGYRDRGRDYDRPPPRPYRDYDRPRRRDYDDDE